MLKSVVALIIWIFFVFIYWVVSRNMYERKECILGVKLPRLLVKILGFSGNHQEISIFVLLYQILYYVLSLSAVILLVKRFDMFWNIVELYIYIGAINVGLWVVLYSITRIIKHKELD